MKPLDFVGNSRSAISAFPETARKKAGHQLELVQVGRDPDDWKPMPNIGPGVQEIRVRESGGAYRVIYIARFEESVYVLHAFQKKTQKTNTLDIELARMRLKKLIKERA